MPNKKTAKSKQAQSQQTATTGRRRRRRGTTAADGLDAAAAAHARALADPCFAPLAHPVYGDGQGGMLMRAETAGTFNDAAPTHTAGVLMWTPGFVSPGGNELIGVWTVGAGTTGTALAYGSAPAKGFLLANASAYRCVAACMRISYPGTESGRSGQVYVGNVGGAALDVGSVVAPAQMAQLCQSFSRTPTGEIEVRWKPAFGDARWKDPNAAAALADKDTRSSLLLVFSGLPAGVGLHIRYTAIYEWQPKFDQGLGASTESTVSSRNTIAEVVHVVSDRVGWVNDVMGAMGQGIGKGIASSVAGLFGGIPTVSGRRAPLRLSM